MQDNVTFKNIVYIYIIYITNTRFIIIRIIHVTKSDLPSIKALHDVRTMSIITFEILFTFL